MITVTSDIRLSFEQLNIKFQGLLDNHKKEIELITANAIEKFDFETALDFHVKNKLSEGIDRAFGEIDVSGRFVNIIRNKIEDKLNIVEGDK